MILGIDYGLKRCGLSLSDEGHRYAVPLETVITEELRSRVLELIREDGITALVFGLPLGKLGEKTQMSEAIEEVARNYQNDGVKIFFQDERGSTDSALLMLNQAGVHKGRRKKARDEAAATLILQDFLDYVWPNLPKKV